MAKIKTTLFEKNCRKCSSSFTGSGPAALYCSACLQIIRLERNEKSRIRMAIERASSGKIKKPGSGKGGNPYKGEPHPSYVHGKYTFERIRYEVRNEIKFCERCSKDLINVDKPRQWVVHHKNHDHWDHVRDNLELLCRKCHADEHGHYGRQPKGATTRA